MFPFDYFQTLTSIMGYGLFAGLCLLPVVLSLIGPNPYPDAEDFNTSTSPKIWYRSELMTPTKTLKIPRPQLVGVRFYRNMRAPVGSSSYDSVTEIINNNAGLRSDFVQNASYSRTCCPRSLLLLTLIIMYNDQRQNVRDHHHENIPI